MQKEKKIPHLRLLSTCVKFELNRRPHHKKSCLAANEKMGWLSGKKENSEVPHGLSVMRLLKSQNEFDIEDKAPITSKDISVMAKPTEKYFHQFDELK